MAKLKWGRLRYLSIKSKLMLSYLIIFIMVILTTIFLTLEIKKMALEQALDEAKMDVESISNQLGEMTQMVIDTSNNFSSDWTLLQMINEQYTTDYEVTKDYMDYKMFSYYIAVYKPIEHISIYVDNDTLLNSGHILNNINEIKEEEWYKAAIKNRGKLIWAYIKDGNEGNNLVLVRSIGVSKNKQIGVMVISISNKYLENILNNKAYQTMVVDDKGHIISSNNGELIGFNVNDINICLESSNNEVEEGIYKNQVYKFISKEIPMQKDLNYKVIAMFPVKEILKRPRDISYFIFTLLGIIFLCMFVFISLFSYLFSKRITQLSTDMHEVSSGNLDIKCKVRGEDEIGQLAKDLNVMVEGLKKVINEAYIANMQKQELIIEQKDIRFQMLASQINPHFLFNALEAIRMRAICNNEEEIANIIQKLGKQMRRMLEVKEELVTLKEELEFAEIYIDIQKFRFGERLNYHLMIPEELMPYKILPLLIEPILENAVVHGLGDKDDPGEIKIYADLEEEYFIITVEDNGVGMTTEKLKAVKALLRNGGKSIGLKNVNSRIRLYYGQGYGLKIISEEGQGTIVQIQLPRGELM